MKDYPPDVVTIETDDTKIIRTTGTDGSRLYNVVVDCDEYFVTIAANNARHARQIFDAIKDASWVEVTEAKVKA